jgi:hypothetical protein
MSEERFFVYGLGALFTISLLLLILGAAWPAP